MKLYKIEVKLQIKYLNYKICIKQSNKFINICEIYA